MIIALVLVDIPVKSFTKEQVSAGFIKLSWHQCDVRLIFFHANTLTFNRTVILGKSTKWVDQSCRRCSNYYFLSVYFIQASKAPLLKSVLQNTTDLCFVFAFVSYFSFMQMLTTPTWGKSTKKTEFFQAFHWKL